MKSFGIFTCFCRYSSFKDDLSSCFPTVFDTKQIAYVLRRQLELEGDGAAGDNAIIYFISNLKKPFSPFLSTASMSCTNLQGLMSAFSANEVSSKGGKAPAYCPAVKASSDPIFDRKYDGAEGGKFLHEAGYDAFCTGFCFVKMMHLAAKVNKQLSIKHYLRKKDSDYFGFFSPRPAVGTRPLYFREHLMAMDKYKNQLGLGRAAVTHIVLGGKDPDPTWVFKLRAKTKSGKKLDHVRVMFYAMIVTHYYSNGFLFLSS